MAPISNPNPTATGQDFAATDTDEYSLTMPHSQWKSGAHEDKVTFEIFVRRLPADYGFLLATGLADCLDFLERFRFDEEELEVLASQYARDGDPESGPLYEPGFIEYLRGLRFTGEVYALPEGTVVGPGVTILRLTAPRIQVTIVEAAILATINQATSISTKAARLTFAAQGRPVWDGSLRRSPGGVTAGKVVARSSYIGGLTGTSCVRARVKLGIPSAGTMAHAEIQRWGEDGEHACFENWLTNNPYRAVLLVDTYDTRRGVERAIAASVITGVPIKSIRIDSGDIAELCRWARSRLDAAGMNETQIMLSGDLDDFKIEELLAAGVPADNFLVGTMLANPIAGALGVVYKLTEQHDAEPHLRYVMKRAVGKQTDPGAHRIWRDKEGRQIIALPNEIIPDARQLLQRVMALGRVMSMQPSLTEIRDLAQAEVAELPERIRRLHKPEVIEVLRTRHLWELRASLGDQEAKTHLLSVPLSPSLHLGAVEEGEHAQM